MTEPLPPSPPHPSRRSLGRLDWFVFLVADVQTGFGPFVAVYLTTQHWTQIEIGLVLTVSGLVSLAGQMPGGALVDAARSERIVAGVAVSLIAASALIYATSPIFPAVLVAATMQAAASCVLGPAIAAISLGLVGYAAIGERFGRNARFAAVGTGLSAAVMGAIGYFFSAQAVFFVTAALLIPALFVLRGIVSALEKHHNVRILDEGVAAAVRLSHRYLAGRQLPDKAVSVLDTACARLALGQNTIPPAMWICVRVNGLAASLGTTPVVAAASRASSRPPKRLA